jgi:hypothetical protein
MGAMLIVGAMTVPMGAFAAGNSHYSFSPATVTVASNPSTGIGTFAVSAVVNNVGDSVGASAGLSWDKNAVSLVSMAQSAAPTGCSISAEAGTSDIALANTTGILDGMFNSYFCLPPAKVSAGTNVTVFTATFQTKGFGNTQVTVDAASSYILDAVGSPLTTLDAAVPAVVNNVAPTPTPTAPPATPTPVATPTPAVQGTSGPVNVTGTVDFGFLAVTAPQSVSINLVRNANANAAVPVTVYSNIMWNLQVVDPNTSPATHGFMTAGTSVLANSMHVWQGTKPDPAYPANLLPLYDVNLNTSMSPANIATGASSQVVSTTLAQFTAAQDKPGTYGMTILYSAIPGF